MEELEKALKDEHSLEDFCWYYIEEVCEGHGFSSDETIRIDVNSRYEGDSIDEISIVYDINSNDFQEYLDWSGEYSEYYYLKDCLPTFKFYYFRTLFYLNDNKTDETGEILYDVEGIKKALIEELTKSVKEVDFTKLNDIRMDIHADDKELLEQVIDVLKPFKEYADILENELG